MQAASAGIGINIRKILPSDGSAPLLHHGLYLVTQLAPAGGAARAGYIEVGDVIHAVDGVHVGPLELAAVIEQVCVCVCWGWKARRERFQGLQGIGFSV